MTRIKLAIAVMGGTVALAGCFNMPTKPAGITGSYVSSLKFTSYSCPQLGVESASLARRENELVTAQEARVKSSQMQAFWLGFGQGDGVEAAELANVRGEKEAVHKAMDEKQCGTGTAVSTNTAVTQ